MAIEKRLVPVASSFFTLYAAVGAVMPFHIMYMMDSGITTSEQGIITGLTPLLATFSAPVIGAIADKFKSYRQVTMVCLMLCALSFSLFLAVPVKSPSNTISSVNATSNNLAFNATSLDASWNILDAYVNATSSNSAFNATSPDASWNILDSYVNATSSNSAFNATVPVLSSNGTQKNTTRKENAFTFEISGSVQFWSFLVLRVAAFIFFLPASTLPNAMALTIVSDDPEKFSACRAAGSAGFLVWVLLQSVINEFTTPPSFVAHAKKLNFFVVIVMFDVFMVATAVAIWFYDLANPIPLKDKARDAADQENGKVHDDTALDPLYVENKQQVSEDTTTDLNETEKKDESNSKISFTGGLKVTFCNLELCGMLFVVMSTGLLWTVHECYIYWYVAEMPEEVNPIFWGPALAATVISEVPAVYLSGKLIKRIGEVRCVLIVLVAYIVRFTINGFIRSAWFLLATQPLHGITFGLNNVAFTTFFGSRSPRGYGASVQGIANAAYFGIGAALGGFLGGLLWKAGSSRVFFGCAVYAAFVLVVYSLYQYLLVPRCRPTSNKLNNSK